MISESSRAWLQRAVEAEKENKRVGLAQACPTCYRPTGRGAYWGVENCQCGTTTVFRDGEDDLLSIHGLDDIPQYFSDDAKPLQGTERGD